MPWNQNNTEKCLIFFIAWICLFSLQYQLQNAKTFYHKKKDNLEKYQFGKAKPIAESIIIDLPVPRSSNKIDSKTIGAKPNNVDYQDEVLVEPLDLDYEDSTANNSEVLHWFEARKSFRPIQLILKQSLVPSYLAPESLCAKQPHIIIYFHSHPGHVSKRRIIRQTWASNDNFKHISVERIFLLGRVEDVNEMGDAEDEAKMYRDIILGDFDDTFQNLSYKGLTLLDFVNKKCSGAKYILKADDDFFVNVFLVVEKIISSIWDKEKVVVCHVKENSLADTTNKNGRWYIDPKHLKGSKNLPTFCSGYTVLFSTDLVPTMLNNSLSAPFISVDDVYIFGFLLQNVRGLNMKNAFQSFTLNQNVGLEEYLNDINVIEHLSVMTYEEAATYKIWNAMLKRLTPLGKQMINFNKFKKKI